MFDKWFANVLSFLYCDSERGDKREIEPVWDVIKISCSGIVASAAMSIFSGVAGNRDVDVVRGRSVIVVGMWPPRENIVRWRRKLPPLVFGSKPHQLAKSFSQRDVEKEEILTFRIILKDMQIALCIRSYNIQILLIR